jgi:hypothetical protein
MTLNNQQIYQFFIQVRKTRTEYKATVPSHRVFLSYLLGLLIPCAWSNGNTIYRTTAKKILPYERIAEHLVKPFCFCWMYNFRVIILKQTPLEVTSHLSVFLSDVIKPIILGPGLLNVILFIYLYYLYFCQFKMVLCKTSWCFVIKCWCIMCNPTHANKLLNKML